MNSDTELGDALSAASESLRRYGDMRDVSAEEEGLISERLEYLRSQLDARNPRTPQAEETERTEDMSDSYFDMPSGYTDADLEMSELEDLGNRYARRYKGFTRDEIEALRRGEHLTTTRWFGPSDARRSYTVRVRSVDADEVGPILEWSLDCRIWKSTARQARLDHADRTGALAV